MGYVLVRTRRMRDRWEKAMAGVTGRMPTVWETDNGSYRIQDHDLGMEYIAHMPHERGGLASPEARYEDERASCFYCNREGER